MENLIKCHAFETLAVLRRDSRVGPAVRGCFEWLWHVAACHPEYIAVTTKQLAFEFGVERRAVEKWLAKLVEFGLVEIVERDKRRGLVCLYVFHPRPDRREPRPDPQRRLAFRCQEEAGKALDLCARKVQPNRVKRPPVRRKVQPNTICPRGRVFLTTTTTIRIWLLWSRSLKSQTSPTPKSTPAQEVRQKATSCLPGQPRSKEWEVEFLFTIAVLEQANIGGDAPGWVADAIAKTIEARPDRPLRYLRSVLINGLVEFLGLGTGENPRQAWAIFHALRRRVAPQVRRHLTEREGRRRNAIAAVKPSEG